MTQETSRWQESLVVGPPPQSVLVLHFPIHMMVECPFALGPSIPLEGCLLPKGVLMQDHAICQNWGSKLVALHLQSRSPHPLHLRHLPYDIAVRYPPAPSLGLQQQSHQPDVQSARGLEMEPTNEVDLKIVLGVLSPCYIYGRFAYLYSTKESVYNVVNMCIYIYMCVCLHIYIYIRYRYIHYDCLFFWIHVGKYTVNIPYMKHLR